MDQKPHSNEVFARRTLPTMRIELGSLGDTSPAYHIEYNVFTLAPTVYDSATHNLMKEYLEKGVADVNESVVAMLSAMLGYIAHMQEHDTSLDVTGIVGAWETIETISTAMVRKCYRRIGEAKENNLDDTSEESDA